jgi:hypothetical protein
MTTVIAEQGGLGVMPNKISMVVTSPSRPDRGTCNITQGRRKGSNCALST